jgi:hypothetical protein
LERVLDEFPEYHMNILLLDFNAKVSREDISKPAIAFSDTFNNIYTKLRMLSSVDMHIDTRFAGQRQQFRW